VARAANRHAAIMCAVPHASVALAVLASARPPGGPVHQRLVLPRVELRSVQAHATSYIPQTAYEYLQQSQMMHGSEALCRSAACKVRVGVKWADSTFSAIATYFGRARRTMLCASVKVEAVPSATIAAQSITLDRPCPARHTYIAQGVCCNHTCMSKYATRIDLL
jgi:hypothetical protein